MFSRVAVALRTLISLDMLGWSNPFRTPFTWRVAQKAYDYLGIPVRNALRMHEGKHEFGTETRKLLLDFAGGVFYGIAVPSTITC